MCHHVGLTWILRKYIENSTRGTLTTSRPPLEVHKVWINCKSALGSAARNSERASFCTNIVYYKLLVSLPSILHQNYSVVKLRWQHKRGRAGGEDRTRVKCTSFDSLLVIKMIVLVCNNFTPRQSLHVKLCSTNFFARMLLC